MWLFENLRWRQFLTRAFQDWPPLFMQYLVWVTAFYSVGRFEWPVWPFDCFKTADMNYHDVSATIRNFEDDAKPLQMVDIIHVEVGICRRRTL